ncbi:MAG TPA: glycosyltransferase family 4 protein [Chloroflexota bacterium]|nr:glycosyltransferase family 4 protein [Chloroflexota bacterium]
MKIGLVSPYDYPYPGGVTNHIRHLYREFRALGHDVRILAPSSDRNLERECEDVYRVGGVRRVRANGSIARITLSFRLARRTREILANEQFDVIHAHEPLMPSLPPTVLRYSTALNIGTFHAYRGSYYGYFYGRPMLRRVFDSLDGRIAVSFAAKRFVRQYFMAPYRVIPNGVDVSAFDPAVVEPLPELSDGRPNILFLGRPEKRKGVGYLLRAYPHIKRACPEARIIIAGAGDWEHSPYRAFIESHGFDDILVVGQLSEEEKARYFRSAHVFCAPAVQGESFGIVLLEAMAARLPVVTTNIEGYRDVVSDEREGLLVPPRDEEALAGAVCRLLEDNELAQKLGAAGRIKAQQYAWDRIASQVLDFYAETARRATPAAATSSAAWTAT